MSSGDHSKRNWKFEILYKVPTKVHWTGKSGLYVSLWLSPRTVTFLWPCHCRASTSLKPWGVKWLVGTTSIVPLGLGRIPLQTPSPPQPSYLNTEEQKCLLCLVNNDNKKNNARTCPLEYPPFGDNAANKASTPGLPLICTQPMAPCRLKNA